MILRMEAQVSCAFYQGFALLIVDGKVGLKCDCQLKYFFYRRKDGGFYFIELTMDLLQCCVPRQHRMLFHL